MTTSSPRWLPFLEERVAFAVAEGDRRAADRRRPGYRLRQDAAAEPHARPGARARRRARLPGARRALAQAHGRKGRLRPGCGRRHRRGLGRRGGRGVRPRRDALSRPRRPRRTSRRSLSPRRSSGVLRHDDRAARSRAVRVPRCCSSTSDATVSASSSISGWRWTRRLARPTGSRTRSTTERWSTVPGQSRTSAPMCCSRRSRPPSRSAVVDTLPGRRGSGEGAEARRRPRRARRARCRARRAATRATSS